MAPPWYVLIQNCTHRWEAAWDPVAQNLTGGQAVALWLGGHEQQLQGWVCFWRSMVFTAKPLILFWGQVFKQHTVCECFGPRHRDLSC